MDLRRSSVRRPPTAAGTFVRPDPVRPVFAGRAGFGYGASSQATRPENTADRTVSCYGPQYGRECGAQRRARFYLLRGTWGYGETAARGGRGPAEPGGRRRDRRQRGGPPRARP